MVIDKITIRLPHILPQLMIIYRHKTDNAFFFILEGKKQ